MQSKPLLSIRTYLLLLVAALAIPLATMVGYGIYRDMQSAVAQTKASLRILATVAAKNAGSRVAGARETLERLAARPAVKEVDEHHCDSALKDLHSLYPGFSNIVYTDLDGRTVCSAMPQPGGKPVNVGRAPWFRKLVDERRFSVGQPHVGPISGKWVAVLSAPIWNERQEMVGAVHLPLELAGFDPQIPSQYLPPDSRYGFLGEDGTMIWRNLDPERVIGTKPEAEAAQRVVQVRDGEFESPAVDAVNRFYAVVPVPEAGWIAFVGVPSSAIYAEARQRAVASAAVGLLGLLALVVLAIAIARRIEAPVNALAAVSRAIRLGDADARALPAGPAEIATVAEEFNAMVAARLESESMLRESEEQAYSLAFFDPLTGLPNRRLLMDRLQHSMAASARSAKYRALLFLDLDRFKILNDTLGHEIGDRLLAETGQRLQACVREGDTVARLGGDEFVVLLEQLSTDAEEAAGQAGSVADKIIARLGAPCQLGKETYRGTASVGVALFLGHETSLDEILRRADLAMYQAKAAGRNTTRFFDPAMQAAIAARAAMDKALRRAVEAREFVLYYQPQLDAAGTCIGVEALIRWRSPERGFVSPAEFIPLAEETGLILPIGDWVLQEACARLVAWQGDPATAALSVAVNVSAKQFREPGFVETVKAAIAASGAAPGQLKLEITESMLMENLDDIIAKMFALKAMGISFSLDDFGTGYSSLSYVKRLPLDQLKIDQSFVRDILMDQNDAAICRAIIALGDSLGLDTIAEGVESASQWDFLAAEGCRGAQGYYYARPMPADQLVAWLRERVQAGRPAPELQPGG